MGRFNDLMKSVGMLPQEHKELPEDATVDEKNHDQSATTIQNQMSMLPDEYSGLVGEKEMANREKTFNDAANMATGMSGSIAMTPGVVVGEGAAQNIVRGIMEKLKSGERLSRAQAHALTKATGKNATATTVVEPIAPNGPVRFPQLFKK